jgi:seryl-tRNA synthetase
MCLMDKATTNISPVTPLNGDILKLFHALDLIFLDLAKDVEAKEYSFPCFISTRDLKKMDYLHSFPQHVTFPVVLDGDQANLKAFQSSTVINQEDEIEVTRLAPIKHILTPAACYHLYIHLQGGEFNQPMMLTTKNTCFRNEKQFIPLERQWSFSMREIVCIGTAQDTQHFLTGMQEKVDTLINKLGLHVLWETATDPFFDPANNPKHWMQRLQPNKQEMVFNKRLAIGSMNNHRNYFGESFAIKVNGELAHSACVAFGLERWVAAILDQFGPDRTYWPVKNLGTW